MRIHVYILYFFLIIVVPGFISLALYDPTPDPFYDRLGAHPVLCFIAYSMLGSTVAVVVDAILTNRSNTTQIKEIIKSQEIVSIHLEKCAEEGNGPFGLYKSELNVGICCYYNHKDGLLRFSIIPADKTTIVYSNDSPKVDKVRIRNDYKLGPFVRRGPWYKEDYYTLFVPENAITKEVVLN